VLEPEQQLAVQRFEQQGDHRTPKQRSIERKKNPTERERNRHHQQK